MSVRMRIRRRITQIRILRRRTVVLRAICPIKASTCNKRSFIRPRVSYRIRRLAGFASTIDSTVRSIIREQTRRFTNTVGEHGSDTTRERHLSREDASVSSHNRHQRAPRKFSISANGGEKSAYKTTMKSSENAHRAVDINNRFLAPRAIVYNNCTAISHLSCLLREICLSKIVLSDE